MHALSSVPSSVYAGSEFSKVISYIDAKLVQAEARATAAEAKLAAIESAARALLQYLDNHSWGLVPEGQTSERLRALVAPQADESGLPG